ncbi:MAG: type II secretion system minor pseudopilin GspK [Roseateles asaccharophilus]|uniref:Type II secretion system protein K n=1 Tax=Roseateles asaccharophilus TaxID=582607 RepID=A0A4R6N2H6_9BURK|nr:type II secretion system minor pseudopilin GspK [Roseateles asaccharophilus]MDN3544105.1 type II secretion system minor pseudopilin GspK [Roseateles asaccharophilus]TDP09301.1 type II secretion system protein K (GspK) [Roseateles asaccharophilus]
MSRLGTGRRKQRGAALLTAMLIVSLVASLAGAMVWRQYRAVQIEAAERARAQSAWILQGALDWARLILREDARANRSEPVDHLGEIWAVPLAEARLSTFLAADRNNNSAADEGPEAFLSGSLADAQAQYNLRNLLRAADPALELRTLERLCESAGLPADTAARINTALRQAFAEGGENTGADAPLRPQSLEQLQWLGLPAESVERLRPLLTLLPTPTPVNLNTAPREVIAALFDGMDLATAQRMVQQRQNSPLRSLDEARTQLPSSIVLSAERASVASSHFIVSGRLRLEERVLEERSLIRRRDLEMQVISRERSQLQLKAGR